MARTGSEREAELRGFVPENTALADRGYTRDEENGVVMPQTILVSTPYPPVSPQNETQYVDHTQFTVLIPPLPDFRAGTFGGEFDGKERLSQRRGSTTTQSAQITPSPTMPEYLSFVPDPIPAIPVIPTLGSYCSVPNFSSAKAQPRSRRKHAAGLVSDDYDNVVNPAVILHKTLSMDKRNERERAARAQETEDAKTARQERRREDDRKRELNISDELKLERKQTRRDRDSQRRKSLTRDEREAYNIMRRDAHRRRKEKKSGAAATTTPISSNPFTQVSQQSQMAVPAALSMGVYNAL